MYPEFKKFVNLIGHDITISGHGTLPRAEVSCRVETKQRIIGKVAGVPIAETHFEQIANLPDPEEGVYYIVSRVVMDFVPFNREDVFCVDTGPTAVRDENGQVIAVTQLSI
ncbi:MAG: hypothetical protein RL621_180 [Bacteroidota bacterium]|jgi:hypothetical protein